ncbi:MAG: diguanylate cyclase [Cyanobacteria bacterium P01_D01_bin.1]
MFKRFQGLPRTLAFSPFRVLERSNSRTTACTDSERSFQTLQNNTSRQTASQISTLQTSTLQPLPQPSLTRYHQLKEVERKIRKTLDLSTILGTTVVESAMLFEAYQVALIQFDSKRQSCRQASRYCRNQSLSWQSAFTFSQTDFPSLLAQLWQGRSIYLSKPDRMTDELVRSHPSLSRDIQNWQSRWSGSWLLVPIQKRFPQSGLVARIDSQYWGIFALALADEQDWPEGSLSDTQSIVLELSAAMEHSFQYQELLTTNSELQKLALSDGLTSLANRRRFDKYIEDEWQRLAREHQPLSLILCDIDHFKHFNDAFGHPAGDRCLIRIARALLKVPQRPADLVARYGGEEFAIVLPNTDTHGAWRIAQSIHQSIQTLRIAHTASSAGPYVTVTMGVSTIVPGAGDTIQTLIRAADIALYYAKQQGRNRTYINGYHNTINLADAALRVGATADSKLRLTPNE